MTASSTQITNTNIHTHMGALGEEHIQFGWKCLNDTEVKSIFVDITIDPITRKISSRKLYLDTKSGNSSFRHESAKMGMNVPKENTIFVTRQLAPALKDSMGWSNAPNYTVSLSEYDVGMNAEIPEKELLRILLEKQKISDVDAKAVSELISTLEQKAESAMTARPFKLPLETPVVKITRKDGEKHKGLLITVNNLDPGSPLAAIIMRVVNRDPKDHTINPDSVGNLEYYYVPRQAKRGNFTGATEFDSLFSGKDEKDTVSSTRGLSIGYKQDHEAFLKEKCGVEHPVDIAVYDPEKSAELYDLLKSKKIIHPDTNKQIQSVIQLVANNALYHGERNWTQCVAKPVEPSRIILP